MYFFFVDCIIYFFVFLFNSDNGKEFIVTVVVDILKESNPNCYIVTGRPRTPRDQGSVESATMVVRQVLKCILSENCLQSIKVNWTKLLGQVMAVCNSHSGIRKNSVSSYKVVFGQKYHQQLKRNMSEMRECKLIFQRLKLSLNEQLETYVWQHDIVDIEVDDTESNKDNDNNSYDSENEGEDLDENVFPELHFEADEFQIGDLYNAGVFDGTSALVASTMSVVAAAAVVAKASVPTITGGGGGREGGHGGGGSVSGVGGGGIGYFSSVGSGGGSGSGSGSGSSSSSGRVGVSTTAVEAAVAGG